MNPKRVIVWWFGGENSPMSEQTHSQWMTSIPEPDLRLVTQESELLEAIVSRHQVLTQQISPCLREATRQQLATASQAYMSQFLHTVNLEAVQRIGQPESIILELGNSPKIFHLGMMRMLIKALSWAERITQQTGIPATVLYIHTDSVLPDVIAEARWLRYYVRGQLPTKPFTYGTSATYKHLPSKDVPVPTKAQLETLKQRLVNQARQNISYAEELGWQVIDSLKHLEKQIASSIDQLVTATSATQDFASWSMHYHWNVLTQMLGAPPNLIIFPTSQTVATFPELITQYLQHRIGINALQGQSPDDVDLWIYCSNPVCRTRSKPMALDPISLDLQAVCPKCGQSMNGKLNCFETAPEVIARQSLFCALGLAVRIVGNIHSYALAADRVAEEILNFPVPIRLRLGGQPRFMGIGEPAGGCNRTAVLRALFEVEPTQLHHQLANSPLSGEIYIQSPMINPAKLITSIS